MLQIDGSHGLGSGQLVRTALSFSTLTKTPIKITNIRSKRPSPGLKPQHFSALLLLKEIANAETKNLKLNSTEVEFIPKDLAALTTKIDIQTAGSITLLIQNILLPLIFAPEKSKLNIIGGTDVPFSPSFDYLKNVFIPSIEKYTNKISIESNKRGFYPKGQGEISLEITPKYKISEFKNFKDFHSYLLSLKDGINLLDQGKITSIEGNSIASLSLQKAKVAERLSESAKLKLNNYKVSINNSYTDSLSPGCVITLWLKTNTNCILGSDILGERNKTSEEIGKACALKLLKDINSKSCADVHLADHLIPFLALFGGSLKTSCITDHLLTNVWITEEFFGKCIKIDDKDNVIVFKQ